MTTKFAKDAKLYSDDYCGKVKHSFKLFHPWSLRYCDDELLKLDKEIKLYFETGVTSRSNDELWDIWYALRGNLHPETDLPINKFFRWSSFVPTNIPLIVGISCLPPTPFNQIFFQSLNQSYNFGNNIANASASNVKSNTELGVSYIAAITSAIAGSAGLRSYLQKRNPTSFIGKAILAGTPYIGLVFASSVNLFFSRSKEVLSGVPVNDPRTNEPIPDLKSRRAAISAFVDSWLVRITMPIPLIFIPMLAGKVATKHFKFYQSMAPKLLFDSTVVGITLWGAMVGVISGISNVGTIKLGQLEEPIRKHLKEFGPETEIKFNKGL